MNFHVVYKNIHLLWPYNATYLTTNLLPPSLGINFKPLLPFQTLWTNLNKFTMLILKVMAIRLHEQYLIAKIALTLLYVWAGNWRLCLPFHQWILLSWNIKILIFQFPLLLKSATNMQILIFKPNLEKKKKKICKFFENFNIFVR